MLVWESLTRRSQYSRMRSQAKSRRQCPRERGLRLSDVIYHRVRPREGHSLSTHSEKIRTVMLVLPNGAEPKTETSTRRAHASTGAEGIHPDRSFAKKGWDGIQKSSETSDSGTKETESFWASHQKHKLTQDSVENPTSLPLQTINRAGSVFGPTHVGGTLAIVVLSLQAEAERSRLT